MGRTHPNLVGHWRFEDNLTDTSGNGNNAVLLVGAESYQKGKIGQCWSNTGQSLDSMIASSTFVGTPFTLALWFNPSQITESDLGRYRLFTTASGSASRANLSIDNSKLSMRTAANVIAVEWDIPAINQWYHAAAVWDGSNSQLLYVNGILIGTNNRSMSSGDSVTAKIFGQTTTNLRVYRGLGDDLQIWNRALAPHQIAAIYNGVDPAFIGDVA